MYARATILRLGAPLGVLLWLLLTLAPAQAAPAADSPRCAVAGALVDAGHPQRAATLIDTIRLETAAPGQCFTQARAATAAITSASTAARAGALALARVPDDASPDVRRAALAGVRSQVRPAHRTDLDNAQAAAVLDQAQTSLREIVERDSLAGRVGEGSRSWTTFASTSGADLVRLALVAVSTALLVLLLARLLLLAPARWGPVPLHPSRLISWAPLALVVDAVAAVLTASWLAGLWAGDWSGRRPVVLVVLLLAALVLTWGWLFHRGRVAITMQVKGAPSPTGAAAVVGHLRSLGAASPRGLEIPLGGDAQTLDGSNISAPVLKGVLGGVLGFFQSALAVTPWRVLVDADSDEQTVAIVSRHGRVQDSAVIRSDMFGPDGPRIDPLKLVAALALMTILDSRGSWRGLGGARDWRSVGLQYDAVTGRRPEPEALQLLARAVDRDPTSWLARMSYRVTLSRHSENAEELQELHDWLRAAAARQRGGDEALRVRMLYSAYAALLNHLCVMRAEGRTCSCPAPKVVGYELQDAIDRLARRDRGFAVQVREAKRALDTNETTQVPRISWPELSPATAFTYACFWAQRALETHNPAEVVEARDTAIELLKYAVTDAGHRDSAATDHMLEELRATNAYRRAFAATARTELTDIAPFEAHEVALAKVGLTEPGLLTRWPLADLSASLGCSVDVARVVRDKALLVMAVPPGPWIYPLEVVDALATMGIDTIEKLDVFRRDPVRRPAVAETITTVCAARGLPDPDRATIDRWLLLVPRTVIRQRAPS